MNPKDMFGHKLFVGDEVAFNPPAYKGLVIGRIISFTPQGANIAYKATGKQSDRPVNVSFHSIAKKICSISSLLIDNADRIS